MAAKVWSLPRFWVSIHCYKNQLVKKNWGRILDLAWLKFAVAALYYVCQNTQIISFSFLASGEMSGKPSIKFIYIQDVEETAVELNEMMTTGTRAEKKEEDKMKQSKMIQCNSLKDIQNQNFDRKTVNFLSSQLLKNIQSTLSSEKKNVCNSLPLCIGLYSDGFDPDHI